MFPYWASSEAQRHAAAMQALDRKNPASQMMLDFPAASDAVDHVTLLRPLEVTITSVFGQPVLVDRNVSAHGRARSLTLQQTQKTRLRDEGCAYCSAQTTQGSAVFCSPVSTASSWYALRATPRGQGNRWMRFSAAVQVADCISSQPNRSSTADTPRRGASVRRLRLRIAASTAIWQCRRTSQYRRQLFWGITPGVQRLKLSAARVIHSQPLVIALALMRLDHCNAVFAGLPDPPNVGKKGCRPPRPFSHAMLERVRGLPGCERMELQLCVLAFWCLNGAVHDQRVSRL